MDATIPFKDGSAWIAKLLKKLTRNSEELRNAIEGVNQIIIGDPLELLKIYVEPECQDTNPANSPDEEDLANTKSVYKLSCS